MRYSCFGMFFLRKMCLDKRKKLDKVTRRDWYKFIPYLKRFFVTFKDYYQIVRNIAYIKEDIRRGAKETPFFMTYVIGELRGISLSYSEMWEMPYKTFFKLYLYTIADKLMVKEEKKGEYHR